MWAFFEQPNLLTFFNLQSSPLIIFVALSWSHSSISMCSLAMGRPTQHPESRIQNPDVSPQVRTAGKDSWLRGFTADNLSIRTFRSFSANLISRLSASSMDWCMPWGYFFPWKRLCVSLSWVSWGSCLSIPPACPDPFEWQHTHMIINHSLQFCVICKLVEDAWCASTQVCDEGNKQHFVPVLSTMLVTAWSWNPRSYCPCSPAVQPVFNPCPCPFICLLLHQYVCEDIKGDSGRSKFIWQT